jgi:hypothetical protein
MNEKPTVLSLTPVNKAGFCIASEISSSIKEIFLPPSAVECDDTGKFRKLNTLPLSCAAIRNDEQGAKSKNRREKRSILVIIFINRLQR